MSKARETLDAIQVLRDDFRSRLEVFYARLKLAPPYHSVEKAIVHLTASLNALAPEERQRVPAMGPLPPGLCGVRPEPEAPRHHCRTDPIQTD